MRYLAYEFASYSLGATALAVALCVLGCASTANLTYPGHKTFTEENASQLEVGMSPGEVRGIFGEPDEELEMDFGEDVGEPWTGYVWVYFTEVDRRLKYAKRYKKSLFVFYPPGKDMRLNHWVLEE